MRKLSGMGGRSITDKELAGVEAAFGRGLPKKLRAALLSLPWICLSAELDEDDDLSQFGVDMRVHTPKQMILGLRYEPGKTASRHGYFPIGACLVGSADPYFVRLSDGAVVRVPHDNVAGGSLEPDDVDLVAKSLSVFVAKATWS